MHFKERESRKRDDSANSRFLFDYCGKHEVHQYINCDIPVIRFTTITNIFTNTKAQELKGNYLSFEARVVG